MNENELKEYLKNHLQVNLWYDDDNTVEIDLCLNGEVISESRVYLPFKSNDYDDYGNVKN
jgi:hypothetical protein